MAPSHSVVELEEVDGRGLQVCDTAEEFAPVLVEPRLRQTAVAVIASIRNNDGHDAEAEVTPVDASESRFPLPSTGAVIALEFDLSLEKFMR